jgi:Ca-activated chloride channel family protein
MPRCAIFLILLTSAFAQQTLKVSVTMVTVGVRVTDAKDREVKGLTQKDFALYDNGKLQEIAFFSNEELPISLALLLDRSDSMAAGKQARAKEAALFLMRSSHPGTEFLFLPFDLLLPPTRGFTEDRSAIESQIQQMKLGTGTALYDCIIETLHRCAAVRLRRQALIVITDGADQHSTHTLDQLIREVQESQAQVYMVGYFNPDEDRLFRSEGGTIWLSGRLVIDNPLIVFRRLASESGAEAFFPQSDAGLRQVAERISSDVRQQYTLAFYPPRDAAEGSYRKLRVKVNRPGVKVRARPGYLLPAQR